MKKVEKHESGYINKIAGIIGVVITTIAFIFTIIVIHWTVAITGVLFIITIIVCLTTNDGKIKNNNVLIYLSAAIGFYFLVINFILVHNTKNKNKDYEDKITKIEITIREYQSQMFTDSLNYLRVSNKADSLLRLVRLDSNLVRHEFKHTLLSDSIRSLKTLEMLEPQFNDDDIGVIITEFWPIPLKQRNLVCECNDRLAIAIYNELSEVLKKKVKMILLPINLRGIDYPDLEARRIGSKYNADMIIWGGEAHFIDPTNIKTYGAEIIMNISFPEPLSLKESIFRTRNEKIKWEKRQISFHTDNILNPFKKGCVLISNIITANKLMEEESITAWFQAGKIFEDLVNNTVWKKDEGNIKSAFLKQKIYLNIRIASQLKYNQVGTILQKETHITRAIEDLQSDLIKESGFKYASLAEINALQNNIDQSIKYYKIAIDSNKEESEYRIQLATLYYNSSYSPDSAKITLENYIKWVSEQRGEYAEYLLRRVRDELTIYQNKTQK